MPNSWFGPSQDGTLADHLTVGGVADNRAGGLGQRAPGLQCQGAHLATTRRSTRVSEGDTGKYRLDIDKCFLTLDFPPIHDVAFERRLQIDR